MKLLADFRDDLKGQGADSRSEAEIGWGMLINSTWQTAKSYKPACIEYPESVPVRISSFFSYAPFREHPKQSPFDTGQRAQLRV